MRSAGRHRCKRVYSNPRDGPVQRIAILGACCQTKRRCGGASTAWYFEERPMARYVQRCLALAIVASVRIVPLLSPRYSGMLR